MSKKSNATGCEKPKNSTQFKPGQSGNPRGRPRKARYEPPQMTGLDIMDQPFAKMIEEEGFRPIEVSNGKGETEEIPAFQAVIRSLVHQAAKGSRLAARQFVELFSSLQRERRAEKETSLGSVLSIKLLQEQFPDAPEVQLFKQQGFDPDGIRINTSGLMDFDVGPGELTVRQIAELNELREMIVDELSDARDKLACADNDLIRQVRALNVERLDDQFRRVNAMLPNNLQLSFLDAGEHEAGD